MKPMRVSLFCLLLALLVGCNQLPTENFLSDNPLVEGISAVSSKGSLAEVAPPQVISNLGESLEQYLPQVKFITPRTGQTYQQTDIKVELEVADLPIFRDSKLGLGNHLNLIVDNEPAQEVYDTEEPIILRGLSPGTHTLRVFAATPWEESFKNEAAFTQTTFNILTETNDNHPSLETPLLTYNSPSGTLGAEPFLLDFYLTNTPLHQIANNSSEIEDWRIRATINGTSFVLENWQPVYLTGLKTGENWVQLELIDEFGKNIENAFNNTVRVFNYDPQVQDTLTRLVTNKINITEAQALIEPNYYVQPVGSPEILDLESGTESIENNIDEETPSSLDAAEVIDETENTDSTPKQDSASPVVSPELPPAKIAPTQVESTQLDQAASSTPLEEGLDSLSTEDSSVAVPEVKEEESSKLTLENASETQPSLGTENITPLAETVGSGSESFNQLTTPQRLETADVAIAETTESETLVETTETKPLPANPPAETFSIESKVEGEDVAENIDLPIVKSDGSPEDLASSNVQQQVAKWWKRTLVTLRQGLESIAKFLPSKV